MPYVDIRVAGKLNIEQKREIAKEVSETLERIAKKPKESVYISFSEFERESFAKGENILSDLDNKQK
ncbi:4-oxalocrotonate tautomerase [Helicobacter anseris]|uniref:4-oxalocrotonate tautomerase n=1 Tax=Helicobacter anseris TaxID=375926 RepID=A0A3D8JAG4_9HELI|nr:tautomerase family protein [Helicobacter anseris]RDU73891.1 4-oxalocrotonate tautomerase [Helicobacter anseris]